jgi:hypothetical protein
MHAQHAQEHSAAGGARGVIVTHARLHASAAAAGARTGLAAHAPLPQRAEALAKAGGLAAAALQDAQRQLAGGQADRLRRRVLARDRVQERQVRAAPCARSHALCFTESRNPKNPTLRRAEILKT